MASLSSRGMPTMSRGEAAIDVQRLLAGHRMGAHHRDARRADSLACRRRRNWRRGRDRPAFAVVERGQALEIRLHAVGQRLVGRVHVGEQRVAAVRRAGLDVEDGAHRRLEVAGHVGVPALAVGARLTSCRRGSSSARDGRARCGAAGWMCRSPNSRPKARCWSGVMCWSRKKITRFSASARWISSCWPVARAAWRDRRRRSRRR